MNCELFRRNCITKIDETDLNFSNDTIAPKDETNICIILFTDNEHESKLLQNIYNNIDQNTVGMKLYECSMVDSKITNIISHPTFVICNTRDKKHIVFDGIFSIAEITFWILLNLKEYLRD